MSRGGVCSLPTKNNFRFLLFFYYCTLSRLILIAIILEYNWMCASISYSVSIVASPGDCMCTFVWLDESHAYVI